MRDSEGRCCRLGGVKAKWACAFFECFVRSNASVGSCICTLTCGSHSCSLFRVLSSSSRCLYLSPSLSFSLLLSPSLSFSLLLSPSLSFSLLLSPSLSFSLFLTLSFFLPSVFLCFFLLSSFLSIYLSFFLSLSLSPELRARRLLELSNCDRMVAQRCQINLCFACNAVDFMDS